MINKVILVGNLGADPELKETKGNTKVCTLRVATTDNIKKKDGTWEKITDWHMVVLFGSNALNASEHLSKGRQVYIEGRLKTDKYTDKDGNERYQTKVIGDNIRYLGSKDGAATSAKKEPNPYEESSYSNPGNFDDDIPF